MGEIEVNEQGQIRYTKNKIHIKIRYYAGITVKGKYHNVGNVIADAFLEPKPDKEYEVDHIDRNKLNNHSSNLRWITRSENQLNRRKAHRHNSQHYSPYKGVYKEVYRTGRVLWRLSTHLKNLGGLKRGDVQSSVDPVIVAKIADKIMREHHKELAVLNFPEEN